MSTEIQNLLCSCSSGYNDGVSNRCVQQKDYYNEHDIIFRYDSDRDDKLLNDWKGLDDDSWDVISALRQKFCQLSKSEVESTTINESLHSSNACTNRQPYEYESIVERASNLIDYTPESEFLKKIKRQCQYLQNRLPNIFSALNDCFPESNVHECQKCLTLRRRVQLNNNRSWKCCSQQSSFSDDIFYRNKKNRMKHCPIFQGPCSEAEPSRPPRLEECRRQSEHISRSKKPVRRKKIRKRKQSKSGKCVSDNNFEPSLKKPSENSCERCWRYASPARSPVNKPDQRFNPNFRKGHSTTDLEKGSGDLELCEEAEGAVRSEQQNASPDVELPCARHTHDTSNRSPETSPQVPPHICIKQKMEGAMQMGSTCPKHRCSTGPPEPAYPADHTFNQHECPKHRASPQLPANTPHSRNTCSKHMGSTQQPESVVRQKHKCPVHNSESPQQRHSQQKCPHLKSPEPAQSQQRTSPVRCSQQRSPQPGTSHDGKHTCRHEEPPRGVLCSSPEKKTKTQSCTSGSKEMPRSPIMDDLDVTEYRDICMKSRKQNSTPPPNPCSPCNKIESARRACGACPSKPPRTCDDHGRKMESIPEASGEEKQTDKSGDGGDKITSKDSDSKSGKKASKLEKKPKSPGDSKKGPKKSRKGESPKKSPDKSKLSRRSSDKKPTGTCPKSGPFDKAHPIRPCKCPPRIPENEMPCGAQGKGGHTLCCHCDWGENNHQSNNFAQNASPQSKVCSCNPTRRSEPPESVSPVPKPGTMECPYRSYMNKYGDGRPQGVHGPPPEGGRCWRENHTEISTQELLEYCPRKYFVFYMANNKDNKKENDVQVLVEELAQGDPKNDKDSKTKDITEKMKKINKLPPDSMALRFQKGVSEACNVPQSSRILYF